MSSVGQTFFDGHSLQIAIIPSTFRYLMSFADIAADQCRSVRLLAAQGKGDGVRPAGVEEGEGVMMMARHSGALACKKD